MSFSFPQVTKMVQFSWYRLLYHYGTGSCDITRRGLPHSEILGSKSVCDSPRLIAAYYVLHRLLEPSHPPKALCSLTTKFVVTFYLLPYLCFLLCSTILQYILSKILSQLVVLPQAKRLRRGGTAIKIILVIPIP